jgi:hypothetical protein
MKTSTTEVLNNQYHHHHHHHHICVACTILALVTCSRPINCLEVFLGVVFGFVSHTVDIWYLSVALRLSLFIAEHAVPFYFRNFESSLQVG